MKKALCLIPVVLAAVASFLCVAAAAAPEAPLTREEVREQIELLLPKLNEGTVDESSQEDAPFRFTEPDYDNLEKVTFTTPLLIEEYAARKTFADVLSEDFHWRLPLRNGQTATVAVFSETDGRIAFEGVGDWKTVSPEELKKAASETLGAHLSADDFTVAESVLYHATFVFFTYDGNEYAVPYFQREEKQIENGKIYACSELFAIMEKVFDESAVKAAPDANGCTVPHRQTAPVPAIVFTAVGCLLIVIVLAATLKRKRRNIITTSK